MSLPTGYPKESKPFTSSSILPSSQPCRPFEFPEILIATKNFHESLVIGEGGFGKVYKADITNGSSVITAAIKRLDSMSQQGAMEFWAEVEMLSMFRHCNLVSLIGYCNHEKEMILVYDYIPNGTLHDHLHKLNTTLSWLQRLKICIGAGRGLHYLHTGTGIQSGIIHRDVKSSNILLDENWAARISDFGLSKICPTNQPSTHVNTHIKGTYGYFDPNYYQTGTLTRKSDVYAFGVVLLEVLCRNRVLDIRLYGEDRNLAIWAQDSIKKGNLKHIIDSHIKSEISPKCLKEFVRIVEMCLHNRPKHRFTMAEVVVSLERVVVLQEKFNDRDITFFDRMVNLLPFPSNGENSVPVQDDSMLSSYDRKDNNKFPEMKRDLAHFQTPSPSPCVRSFEFADLEKATRDFSQDLLLGEGGFGNVFLGWVEQNTLAPSKQGVGLPIAVKKLKTEGPQGHAEWLKELALLGELAHPNIVRLLGYSIDDDERLLVYEYMPYKSLDGFLFSDTAEVLSWETRLLIMIGIVRGLTYLHSKSLIFREIKCLDILLDEDFNAKLGDFGFAKYGAESEEWESEFCARVMGTYGYIAPEYTTTGRLSIKSDIYSLGVVLLESITGRKAYDRNRPDGVQLLVDWATQFEPKRRNVTKLMDPHFGHNFPVQGASKYVELAFRCLAVKPKDRPTSEEVLQSLEQIHANYMHWRI